MLVTAVTGLAAIAVPTGWTHADHVKIEGSAQPPAPPSSGPAASQTLTADHITALEVRADTIYAKKIEADNIQGEIHQTKDVKVGKASGDIKAPQVAALVIYAEEITANTVVAKTIYVRDLDRR
jgi:hypothetical protein